MVALLTSDPFSVSLGTRSLHCHTPYLDLRWFFGRFCHLNGRASISQPGLDGAVLQDQ